MKQKAIVLSLSLCLVLCMIPMASASNVRQADSPEALYQEYLALAADVNARYGTDVTIQPLDAFDPESMPSVDEMSETVEELAQISIAVSNAKSIQTRKTFGNGIGTFRAYEYVYGTIDSKSFEWRVWGDFTISQNASTQKYFLQNVTNRGTTVVSKPSGYTVSATSVVTGSYTGSGQLAYYIRQTYNVHKNGAIVTAMPRADFIVSPSTGKITTSASGIG